MGGEDAQCTTPYSVIWLGEDGASRARNGAMLLEPSRAESLRDCAPVFSREQLARSIARTGGRQSARGTPPAPPRLSVATEGSPTTPPLDLGFAAAADEDTSSAPPRLLIFPDRDGGRRRRAAAVLACCLRRRPPPPAPHTNSRDG